VDLESTAISQKPHSAVDELASNESQKMSTLLLTDCDALPYSQ
jgi:hypothetical protein